MLANCCEATSGDNIPDNMVELSGDQIDECEMPMVSSASIATIRAPRPGTLPILCGMMNGRYVTVLRDTGCTTVIVRKCLVEPHQFTGVSKHFRMVDGSVREANVANIVVDTPFFSGEVDALCLDNPTCDVIIGNVTGALSDIPRGLSVEDADAVSTRAMEKAKDKVLSKLVTANLSELEVYNGRSVCRDAEGRCHAE